MAKRNGTFYSELSLGNYTTGREDCGLTLDHLNVAIPKRNPIFTDEDDMHYPPDTSTPDTVIVYSD